MEGSLRLRKGTWTDEEDNLLRACIRKYGEGKWHLIPQRAGLNRCRKSCRMRWLNYLSPKIKRGDFTEDEVDMIIRLHKLLGNRWSLIAGRLPGRTANDVKNYWHTKLSNKAASCKKNKKNEPQGAMKAHLVIKPKPCTFAKNSPWLRRGPMFANDSVAGAGKCAMQPGLADNDVGEKELGRELFGCDNDVEVVDCDAQSCVSNLSLSSEIGKEWWTSLLEEKGGDDHGNCSTCSLKCQESKFIMDLWNEDFSMEIEVEDPFMVDQSRWSDFPYLM